MKKVFSESSLQHCRVAIVYDRLTTQFGGAEQVLQALVELWPQAQVWTSVFDPNRATWINGSRVKTSWLQQVPFATKFYRAFVGLITG